MEGKGLVSQITFQSPRLIEILLSFLVGDLQSPRLIEISFLVGDGEGRSSVAGHFCGRLPLAQ